MSTGASILQEQRNRVRNDFTYWVVYANMISSLTPRLLKSNEGGKEWRLNFSPWGTE